MHYLESLVIDQKNMSLNECKEKKKLNYIFKKIKFKLFRYFEKKMILH